MRIRKQHSRPTTAPLLDAAEASRDQQRDQHRGRSRDHRHDADLKGAFIPRQITNLA
jgi:hypothetical protein